MSTFDDRLLALLLGGAVGFILGYVTSWVRVTDKHIRAMRYKLDEVAEILTNDDSNSKAKWRRPNEKGEVTSRTWMSIALATVVGLTAFAAFQSQRAINNDKNNARQQQALTSCTASILNETITTLDVRSTFTRRQAGANVELQRAQSKLIATLLHQPPYNSEQQRAAFEKYFEALNGFVHAFDQAETTADNEPYPTTTDFNTCIAKETAKGD